MTARRVNRRKPQVKPAEGASKWSAAQERAEAAMRRSKAAIEAGESCESQR